MLRRWLPVAVLNTLVIICSLALAVLTPNYLLSGFSATTFAKAADQPLKCPDVPDLGDSMLDFCSPKNQGNVTGPYGAHITLASGHLRAQPDHWVFVKDQFHGDSTQVDQFMNDSTKVANCVKDNNCFAASASASNGTEGNKALYTFTWSGEGFPTNPGDYIIVALNGDPSDAGSLKVLAWTPVSFTLLSTQSPCIALSLDPNNSSPCPSTTQTVQLVKGKTQKLVITGQNWQLWNQKDIGTDKGEQVEVTACLKDLTCGTTNNPFLFNVSASVDHDGSFHTTASIPASANGGTYVIQAVNHIPTTNPTSGTDYDLKGVDKNTVADSTLKFGDNPTPALVLNVGPPVTQTRTPTRTPIPPPTPNGSGKTNGSGETNLLLGTWVDTIPAVLSVIAFFGLFLWRRRNSLGESSARKESLANVYQPPPVPEIDLMPIQSSVGLRSRTKEEQSPARPRQENNIAPPTADFLLKHFLRLHMQLLENTQRSSFPRVSSMNPIPSQGRNQIALRQWKQKGELTQAVKVTETLLYGNMPYWRDFYKQLQKASPRRRWSQKREQQELLLAEDAYNAAILDDSQRLRHCSRALTYYTVLLSMQKTVIARAMIHYRIGFIYVLLAIESYSSLEVLELLEEADKSYTAAYPTVMEYYANSRPDFLASIDLAVGDVNMAMLLWQPNKAQECRGKADAAYERAAMYGTDPVIGAEIQQRQMRLGKEG